VNGCLNVHHNKVDCLVAGLDRDETRSQMCPPCQLMAAAPLRHLVDQWREQGSLTRLKGELYEVNAEDLEQHLDRTYPRSRT